jgi:hypothetical protein
MIWKMFEDYFCNLVFAEKLIDLVLGVLGD